MSYAQISFQQLLSTWEMGPGPLMGVRSFLAFLGLNGGGGPVWVGEVLGGHIVVLVYDTKHNNRPMELHTGAC